MALLAVIGHSCANIAAPTGGAYDVDPPKIRKANPGFNALNVAPSRIEIEFDENIKIVKPSEKVIVTPPQKNMPVIRSIGKKAVIELKDTLLPNTTYTVDFTDALTDNNEGNPLENFLFSFSTGDQLDTLSIGGKVLSADNLEPITGMYVGVHSNLHDTAFTSIMFERISRTDSRGNFIVRGVAPGSYRVFGLNDLNRDYKYDNPLENVAFLDSIVIPSTMPAVRQDTVFLDSLTIDTIKTVHYTRFMPDDLVLRSFLSDFQRRFLQKHERPEQNKIGLYFGAPTELPTFSLLNPAVDGNDWFVLERSLKNDTLMLWITDSLIYQQDSIQMKINYIQTDSLNINYIKSDTLNFNFRRSDRTSARARRAEERAARKAAENEKSDTKEQSVAGEEQTESEIEKEGEEGSGTETDQELNEDTGESPSEQEEVTPINFLLVNSNIQSSFELFNPIRIEFDQPVIEFTDDYIQLSMEVDSLYEPVPFRLETDSLNPRKYTLRNRWEPGGKYKVVIDSASVFSHYGRWNNKFEQSFTVKSLDQYGNLEISLSGLPEGKQMYIELLDKSDKPFRKSYVKDNMARFQDLLPGEIYARIIIDENKDGTWTTGNYEEGRQPEMVYYYPGKFLIRAFSDHAEDWDVLATPISGQKLLEITTNKPEEKKRRNPNQEREEQQRQNRQNSSFGGREGGGGGSPVGMRQQTGRM